MIWAAATGWAVNGVADAHATLTQITGGRPRRAFMQAMLDGAVALLHGETVAAGDLFADALTQADGQASDVIVTQLAGLIGHWIADFVPARDRFARVVAQRRAEGSLTELAGSLPLLVIGELCTGHLQAANEATAEGFELLRQLGYDQDEISYLALPGLDRVVDGQRAGVPRPRGIRDAAGPCHRSRVGDRRGAPGAGSVGARAGQRRRGDRAPRAGGPGPFPPTAVLATPECIDATLRIGEPERARLALGRFEAWAPVSRTPLVAGMLSRCRAIIAADAERADLLFREALRHHDLRMNPYERARTLLAYGERLRRDRRRADARIQLRAALDTFEGLVTGLWAERARDELRATGETARKRDRSTIDTLTPQDLRIARLVVGGASNKSVAEQLFLSSRTVEYHLAKVFVKIGVSSRLELAQMPLDPVLAGDGS